MSVCGAMGVGGGRRRVYIWERTRFGVFSSLHLLAVR